MEDVRCATAGAGIDDADAGAHGTGVDTQEPRPSQ
jgi:hypothetical protein